MGPQKLKNVVIVGGGTAGWMSAALLSKYLPDSISVTLVESDEIGTIGVGEATIPRLELFNSMLGVDESEFMKASNATFKLGIEFVDWGALGERYMHPFGEFGLQIDYLPFHNHWARLKKQNPDAQLDDYCLNIVAAKKGKFIRAVSDQTSFASKIVHAYHLDAGKYAKFLREIAEANGVRRVEGRVVEVRQNIDTGFIESIVLASREVVSGDLFIDCSGFRGLLIEETLKTGYDNWQRYLPMDSAFAAPSELRDSPRPYTISTARAAGWTWNIPLQHRIGNGHVFSSKYMDNVEAEKLLRENVDGRLLAEPRLINFTAGRRKKCWNKNCIALGLASGFIEPLESTSIHLIQLGLVNLVALMSSGGIFSRATVKEYNRLMSTSYERIRDFIILHYVVTRREDSEFWRDMQRLELPDVLAHRIELFKSTATHTDYDLDLFGRDSWIAVMVGQGSIPESYNPIADGMGDKEFVNTMAQMKQAIGEISEKMPTHQHFIDRYCKAL